MQVYKKLFRTEDRSAVALGFFDGVHKAHASVISRVLNREGLVPTVLTFSMEGNLPDNKQQGKAILTDEQKLERFEALGVERVVFPSFEEISEISAEEFMRGVLKERLHAGVLSCGYDYTFGKGAAGNAVLLQNFCRENGIALNILPPYEEKGCLVSSTAVREFLLKGEVESANNMLGYSYYITGRVISGRHLGHTLGFPTINQRFSEKQLIPRFGVYKTVAEAGGKTYKSVTNVGKKPTIPGLREPLAETHLIGAQGDFYGQEVRVSFHSFLRPEQKFSDVEELKAAVRQDIERVR